MLSVTIVDDKLYGYQAVVKQNDVERWRGSVTQRDDWQKQLLELIQQAYRTPKGNHHV